MDKITIERETLAGMIYPPKPPPRLCGYIPDGSGVEWNAYDTMQMEAYARAAYADGFAAALAAQPTNAQPTGKAPCARHCEAPAFEGEIRRLKRELQTQAERVRVLREALERLDGQCHGEREVSAVFVRKVCRAALEATGD